MSRMPPKRRLWTEGPAEIPLRLCDCGCVTFRERIYQYPGWHSMLLVVVALCDGCNTMYEDGRMVIDEGAPLNPRVGPDGLTLW